VEKNMGMAKLTWIAVSLMRLLALAGIDRYSLAERFHVHQSMVDNILGYRNWEPTPEQQQFLAAVYAPLEHEGPRK
jgi:hypothetical protein